MADYTKTTWVDEVTKVGPTNLNKLEAGVKDAAEHQNAGPTASRPAADAAHKHHIWTDRQTGVAWYCDGTAWIPMSRGDQAIGTTAKITRAAHASSGETLPPSAGVVVQSAFLIGTTPAGDDTYIDELLLRFWRDSAVTGGTINLDILADDGTGRPGSTVLGSISVGSVTAFPTSRPANASSYRVLPASARVAPGTNIYLNVKRGDLVGGNVYIASGAGGNERFEYQGGSPPFAAASAGSIGVTANTRPPLRVFRNSSGQLVGYIDDDGSVYGPNGRKIALADGTTDFILKSANAPAQGALADVLKQWISTLTYSPSIQVGQKLVTASGTTLLGTTDQPLAGLFLVYGSRASDSANQAFAVGVVDIDYYGASLTMLYNGAWASSVPSNFVVGGVASGVGARSVVMTTPSAIGNANVTFIFLGQVGGTGVLN